LKKEIEVLLFDLGGVLVTWKGVEGLRDFSNGRMTLEEARLFWLNSKWVREFERGQCDVSEFVAGFVDELDFTVTDDQIREAFLTWDRGPMPGALDLLSQLRGRYRLACLSNNEEVHWNRLKQLHQADSYFDKCYLSHEIGMIKPDPDVYEYVIEDIGLEPSVILFFDDNPECVASARQSGMQACLARGVGEVKDILRSREIWPVCGGDTR